MRISTEITPAITCAIFRMR